MISTAQIMKNYLKNGCLITSEQAVLFWKRNYFENQHHILLEFQYISEAAEYPELGLQGKCLPSPSFPTTMDGSDAKYNPTMHASVLNKN